VRQHLGRLHPVPRLRRGEPPGHLFDNAIESVNARYRRAIKARGHFSSEQAALKCLYLATRSLDPTGVGRARWMMRWKPALNAFAITFGDRVPAAETY
jgi:transposase-like protein